MNQKTLLTSPFVGILTAVALGFITPFLIVRLKRLILTLKTNHNGISSSSSPISTNLSIVSTTESNVKEKEYNLWNTAIFFPCHSPEDPKSSLAKLLFYLGEAQRSLKICVMTMTYDPIYDILIQKHKDGVQVRVFTSHNVATRKGRRLRDKGIPVRSKKKGGYSTEMHNKYAIVDDEAILTGSMNWTAVSITQQRENILITTDERIVPKFVNHFELMWADFWDDNLDAEGNRLDQPGK